MTQEESALLIKIHSNLNVLSQMVGQLYSGMLREEINRQEVKLKTISGRSYYRYSTQEILTVIAEQEFLR